MSGDSCGRKLVDLRVLDLKEELEKRSLDVTGNKNALIARLQKAVKDEGNDPDTYLFESLDKRGTPKKATNSRDKTNGDVDNATIKKEDENEELVDEIGTVDNEEDNEEFEENEENEENDENEGSQEDCNNDASMNDNEESINLTIEEDEQKLLHAQATDDKDKKPDKKAIKQEGDSKDDDKENDGADKNDMDNGDGDNKEGSGDDDEKTKKDDSEQKSSSKSTTSKDEKDKSASKTKSSSSSSSSRNLWVSGLSSITRASDLKTIFSKFGKVIGAKVVTNTRTPGTRCYGYVTMNSSADASKCIQHLHRTELHGRIISVERTKSEIGGSGGGGSTTVSSTSRDKKSSSKSREKRKSEDKDKKKDDKETEKKSNEDGAVESATDAKKSESGDKPKSETTKRDGGRRLSRSSRERNRSRSSRNREREREREILSFQKIREERERQRLREKERLLREDERRRRDIRKRQREEEQRLTRERQKLQLERERLEREKSELLRLERERQTLEREKIELERLELKRQQMKIMQSSRIDDTKRSLKRPSSDRYPETDRKRSNTDRRFEAPPPPRFDTALASRAVGNYERPTEKKRDDYATSKRDDYKRVLDVPRHATNYQANARDNHKESRYAEQDPRSNFRRADERDPRNTGARPAYPDRSAGGSSQWHNSGPPAIKSFAGSSMTSGGGGIPNWPSKASDSHWRPVESQDRYDRTYNERSGGGGQYMDPSRQNMFVGRAQDRYGGQMSSRYENGKY